LQSSDIFNLLHASPHEGKLILWPAGAMSSPGRADQQGGTDMNGRMNRACALLIAFMTLLTVTADARAREVKILILNWRGETPIELGFRAGLMELGVHAEFTVFNAEQNKEALRGYLQGVDEERYDLIHTYGTTGTLVTAEKIKKTPILAAPIGYPIESGMIKSWENSGNNIIAVKHRIEFSEQLNFINSLGTFRKIGSIRNPIEKNSIIDNEELAANSKEKNIDFVVVDARSDAEVGVAVAELIHKNVDFVFLSSNLVAANIDKVVPLLNAHKIPTYGPSESLIMRENGALTGIVSSFYEVGKELAFRGKMILDGKKVSEVPSYRMPLERQQILVNRKTAEMLDIVIPYDILRRAKIYPEHE
jgi:putative ABC transport system substrate-binding protein